MKRLPGILMVALLASLLLAGCDLLPGGEGQPEAPPGSGTGEAEPTPDVGQPDGVAQSFLDALAEQNYEAMYSYLSPNSQAEYPLETFVNIYQRTSDTIRLIDIETSLVSVLEAPSGNSAQAAFRAVYSTRAVGDIEEELTMQLINTGERWGIAWSPALIFPEMAGGNTLQLEIENAPRANIYDRNGLWLVSSAATTYTLNIVPGQVGDGFEQDMLSLLSDILRMPPGQVRQQYAGAPADWQVALGDVDAEILQQYLQALESYPPISWTEKSGRRYFNVLAPHVVGYTGFIQTEQVDAYKELGYRGDEIVGQSGLERWGEEYLAGLPGGVLTAWTPGGQYHGEIARRDPEPPQSIYTTLDRNLQIVVQDAIEDAYEVSQDTWAPTAGGASAVVLDVNSGDVLAMYSYPSFDPNALNPNNNHPLVMAGDNYLNYVYSSPLKPLFNRATQGEYPAGSVFKLVSIITALESGVFTPDSTYECVGLWNATGNLVRRDWLEGGHGELTILQGLTASCNPWFYEIGMRTGQENFDLLPHYAREFGMGDRLGIQIAENGGLIPDADWLWQTRGIEWGLDDSVNMAIGQGNVLVTPLQIAALTAAVANGGTVYQPQLVDRIGLISEEPSVVTEPVVLHEADVSDETLEMVRAAMHEVTRNMEIGTAEYRLGSLQVNVAGKTGTAEVGGQGYPHAWFAGFAPYESPEIAVVVMVENGGQGSSVAAPIFRRIVEGYFGLTPLDYPPDWGNPDDFDFVTEDEVGE